MTDIHAQWLWTGRELLQDATLRVAKGRVVTVTPNSGDAKAARGARGRLLLPGFVNAHSHAFQRAFRGHVQWRTRGQSDFWTWRKHMYDWAHALDPDGVQAIAELCFLEMALCGFTQVGEFHYLHHPAEGGRYDDPDELARRVVAAARRVGMRICLLRVAYGRGGPNVPASAEQRRFIDRPHDALAAVERLAANADDGVTVGLAPHSVRALSRDDLCELANYRGLIHVHVSEQPAENDACLAEHGCSPTALLEEVGMLSDRFTSVHMTWPMDGDVARMAAAGARVCVCPTTELDLGDGFLPVDARLRLPLCVGTDSHASIDAFEEIRALELHARGVAGRRNVLAPEGEKHGLAARLLDSGARQGAVALGSDAGVLEAGAPADACMVDLRRVAADGMPPLEAAVFAARPEWVESVWVGGQAIVCEGRHPLEDDIRQRALRVMSAGR